jgi:hypothetical protein
MAAELFVVGAIYRNDLINAHLMEQLQLSTIVDYNSFGMDVIKNLEEIDREWRQFQSSRSRPPYSRLVSRLAPP